MKTVLFIFFVGLSYLGNTQVDTVGYQKAQKEFDEHNYSSALRTINKLMETESHHNLYMLKSEILMEMKEYQKAVDNMVSGLEKFPESFYLHNYMGVLLMSFNENELSASELTTAYELAETDDDRAAALTNRSSAYSSVRAFDKAYNDLIEAHRLDSMDTYVLINLGAICDEIGKTDEGIAFLKDALAMELSDFEKKGVLANLGFQHQNLGMYEVAIDYYNQVLAIDPNEPLGYSNRSYNRMQTGDVKGAMDDIDKSIKLYPENSYAYYVKGLIYLKLEKKKAACGEFQTAIDKHFTERYGKDVEILMKENCK